MTYRPASLSVRRALAAHLTLGLAVAGAPLAGLSVGGTLRSTGYDGLLGADFLARYRVTLDYGARRMYLEPRVGARPRAELDMSGL